MAPWWFVSASVSALSPPPFVSALSPPVLLGVKFNHATFMLTLTADTEKRMTTERKNK